MITVTISGESRDLSDATESWIAERINQKRKEGARACVRVNIDLSGLRMQLSTPSCPAGLGGSRAPNSNEREVLDLWEKRGLNQVDFTAGNLIAFLKQFRRLAAA